MPVGLSSSNVSRYAAAALASLWAMAGLAIDYEAFSAVGPASRTLVDFVANVILAIGASLAFVNAGGWIRMLLIALVVVTIERIAYAAVSGAAFAQIVGTTVAFVAIAAVTVTAIPHSDRR
jgi:hypothetical protein